MTAVSWLRDRPESPVTETVQLESRQSSALALRDRPESPVTETNLATCAAGAFGTPGQAGIAGHGNGGHASNFQPSPAPGQAGIAGHGNSLSFPIDSRIDPSGTGRNRRSRKQSVPFECHRQHLRDRPESPVTETHNASVTPRLAHISGTGRNRRSRKRFLTRRPCGRFASGTGRNRRSRKRTTRSWLGIVALRDRPESPVTETMGDLLS